MVAVDNPPPDISFNILKLNYKKNLKFSKSDYQTALAVIIEEIIKDRVKKNNLKEFL